jgi:hypothetical protein
VVAEKELRGDLRVVEAASDEGKDLGLAVG